MSHVTTLVWLKRDLRLHDHAPLHQASLGDQPALALYVIEPAWLDSPEFDGQHLEFALASLDALRAELAPRGLPLWVRIGPAVEVLESVRQRFDVRALFSHEETGPGWTYDRDRAVARWCRAQGVTWRQWPQTGVVRPLATRNGWAGRWQSRMDAALVPAPAGFTGVATPDATPLPTACALDVAPHGRTLPAANEAAARRTLDDFLDHRSRDYRRALSSPLTAEDGCSRLSPHLAFGTMSMRQVHQATEARIATLKASADADARRHAHALRGFAGRLRWHCHFMQKLEDEPAIEHRNFSRSVDGLRPGDGRRLDDLSRERLQVWCDGRTGYPMVDACMRSLRATGWLNFRMRAMLVSFAAYHLWLHWREPGLFLARQFLDFEPGIHWSQMQMQSGTTGINTLRIYSPAKQALDQDPDGVFVRRWVPELARLPLPFLARPWAAPRDVQRAAGCRIGTDYPAPVVDEQQAVAAAKTQMYGLRARRDVQAEAQAIQDRHGSRKSGLPPSGRKPAPDAGARRRKAPAAAVGQAELFDFGDDPDR